MEPTKKKRPSFKNNIKYYFFEFCDRTSIHGFNYFGDEKRTVWEKAWWAIIISVSFYMCGAMTYKTYYKWKHSPVIVTFATEHTSTWQIPFPAVTICPEVKSVKEVYNYTDYYYKKLASKELTPEEDAKFEYMSLLCDTDEELLNSSFSTVGTSALDFLYEVQPSFSGSVFSATWKGKDINDVSEIFSTVITSQGMCHTFNIIDRSEFYTDIVTPFKDTFSSNGKKTTWSLENGYTTNSDDESYPRRTMIAGTKGGLELILHVSQEDIDHGCGESFQGFRVVIHPPDNIPRVKQQYFRLPVDHSVVVALKPKMMTTSEDLKSYTSKTRDCYFSEERQLKYFRIYNQENCMLECLTNFTLKTCGCVSLHSPRETNTPICGAAIKPCLEKSKSKFTTNQENPETKCDCLPSCSTLEYNTEISHSRWDWRSYMAVQRSIKSWNTEENYIFEQNSHLSHLVLYYKDMQFITSERNELYSSSEFWSNFGGLLGLFTGFSFISAFEVIYYSTIRVLFNLRIYGTKYWSGSKKLSRSNN